MSRSKSKLEANFILKARQRELATAFSHVEKCEELSKKKVKQVLNLF